MPLRLFSSNSQGKLSKKKGSYVLPNAATPNDGHRVVYRTRSATLGSAARSRRHSSPPADLPPSILKKSGRVRPNTSFPALTEGMTPQEMAAANPMPREQELNKMFIQLVVCVCVCVCYVFNIDYPTKFTLYC